MSPEWLSPYHFNSKGTSAGYHISLYLLDLDNNLFPVGYR